MPLTPAPRAAESLSKGRQPEIFSGKVPPALLSFNDGSKREAIHRQVAEFHCFDGHVIQRKDDGYDETGGVRKRTFGRPRLDQVFPSR